MDRRQAYKLYQRKTKATSSNKTSSSKAASSKASSSMASSSPPHGNGNNKQEEVEESTTSHLTIDGWNVPSKYFMNMNREPSQKTILVRGVRLFDIKTEYGKITSIVPFSVYDIIQYGSGADSERILETLSEDTNFKQAVGLLRVHDGKFVAKADWYGDQFEDGSEVIAIYLRADEHERSLAKKLDGDNDNSNEKNTRGLPSAVKQGQGLVFENFLGLEIHHKNGPSPIYLDQLMPARGGQEKRYNMLGHVKATIAAGVSEERAVARFYAGKRFHVPPRPMGRPDPEVREWVLGISIAVASILFVWLLFCLGEFFPRLFDYLSKLFTLS